MTGIIIANRYELIEKVGSGGMAFVYKARCRLLNRFVAVKMLRPEFNEDDEFLKRFDTEAQAAASLSHPNIVSVYDVGKHDKIHFIVMEFVEGTTLKDYLKESGPLVSEAFIDFAAQIASALEHAHLKKIIHHDIKPHNIIITESGLLKVTDFGLARAVSAATTVAGNGAIGSVHYSSPEQARGGFTDEKSDIYSLGVTMYEMAAGRIPFDGDTPVAVAMKHLQKAPTPPSVLNPNISKRLEGIILKAMEKEPRNRYHNAAEIIDDLKVALGTAEEIDFGSRTMRMPHIESEMQDSPRHEPEPIHIEPQPEPTPHFEAPPEPIPEKKKDAVAVIAAIVTTIAIVVVLGIIVFNLLNNGLFVKKGVSVPFLTDMTSEEAREEAQKTGFIVVEDGEEYDDKIEQGKILSQIPAGGLEVSKPGEIKVIISRGVPKVVLADYRGWEYSKVTAELDKLKIKHTMTEEYNETVETGRVVSTNPANGEELEDGKTVAVIVSLGKNPVSPDLFGKTVEEAEAILKEKKLGLGNVSHRESEADRGTIIQQSPVAGSRILEGASVDIVISDGMPEASPAISPSPPVGAVHGEGVTPGTADVTAALE